jgi:Protein of unknown function (DUF3618)
MAAEPTNRSPEQVKREIEIERAQLAEAVEELRSELSVSRALRPKVPMLAGGALAGGFVLAGGIGATMRLLARRSREGRRKAKLGRFSLIDRG